MSGVSSMESIVFLDCSSLNEGTSDELPYGSSDNPALDLSLSTSVSSVSSVLCGIFPKSHVALKETEVQNPGPFERVAISEDNIVREIAITLQLWLKHLKSLYLERDAPLFVALTRLVQELMEIRAEINLNRSSLDRTADIRDRAASLMDWGNKKLSLPLIARKSCRKVDTDSVDLMSLCRIHQESEIKSKFSLAHANAIPLSGSTSSNPFSVGKRREKRGKRHIYTHIRELELGGGEGPGAERSLYEIHISTYDASDRRFLHEQFVGEKRESEEVSGAGYLRNTAASVLFVDFESEDVRQQLYKDLYLVARIYRQGLPPPTPASQGTDSLKRRAKAKLSRHRKPFACGVLGLSNLMTGLGTANEEEQLMRLYSCSEVDFHSLHHMISTKQMAKTTIISNAGLLLRIQVIEGLVNDLEGQMNLKGVHLSRRRDAPILPDSVRNELEICIESGEFEKAGKSSPRNIQVVTTFIDAKGEHFQNSISPSCHAEARVSQHFSSVIQSSNFPRWKEPLRLLLPPPPTPLSNAHLRFNIFHCSNKEKQEKKEVGFAFFPLLYPPGVVRPNGTYTLSVFKEEGGIFKFKDPSSYLGLPWESGYSKYESSEDLEKSWQETSSNTVKDILRLSFTLYSNVVPQCRRISSLLGWRNQPDYLTDFLQQCLTVHHSELLPFLGKVLTTVLNLVATENGDSTPNTLLALKVVGHVVEGADGEGAFPSLYATTLASYADNEFTAHSIHGVILNYISSMVGEVGGGGVCSGEEEALQLFCSFSWFFRFAIRSFQLSHKKKKEDDSNDFFSKVKSALEASIQIFAHPFNSTALTAQVGLMKSCPKIISQMLLVFPVAEVSSLLASFLTALRIDARPLDPEIPHLLSQILSGPLFKNPAQGAEETWKNWIRMISESHEYLLIPIVGVLKAFLSLREHLPAVVDNLSRIFAQMHLLSQDSSSTKELRRNVAFLSEHLLESLVSTILATEKTANLRCFLVTALFDLLRLMSSADYDCLIHSLKSRGGRKNLKDFSFRIFLVFREVICDRRDADSCASSPLEPPRDNNGASEGLLPDRWTTLKLTVNNVMLITLQEFSDILSAEFLEGEEFDAQLWTAFFNLAGSFIVQPILDLDTLQDKNDISERFGDMRVSMCFQFASLWLRIGDKRRFLVTSFALSLLEISLLKHDELRRASIPLFYDLLDAEFHKNGELNHLENVIIDKLDAKITQDSADIEYKNLFKSILSDRILSEEPEWRKEGFLFLAKISRLLELLCHFCSVRDGPEHSGKRMMCIMNLLKFYEDDLGREEMHSRYVHKLHELLIEGGHYPEAAGVLRLYADNLHWGKGTILGDQLYATQPEWERKEALYFKMIQYYDTGKFWEKAIPLCRELCGIYETVLFDYRKLSSILRKMATLYDKIMDESASREEPEYFRVAYSGQGFPSFVQNRIFIYRGYAFEKIGSFTQRLLVEWPEATVLPPGSLKDETLSVSSRMYLQVWSVKPVAGEKIELESVEAPEKIRKYHMQHDISVFRFTRPHAPLPLTGSNNPNRASDFQNLWTERTTMYTEKSMPGVLPWSEVVREESEILSPVQNACQVVREKNEELRKLSVQYGGCLSSSSHKLRGAFSQPLLMVLKGTVEAAVNGGIAMYHKAFFSHEFLQECPEEYGNLTELQTLLQEQVQILEKCLVISAQLVPEDCQPLQNHLINCFDQLRKEIRRNTESPRVRMRRVSGGLHKFSLPTTPEGISPPSRRRASASNFPRGKDMTMSWEPGQRTDEESDENMYESVALSSTTDEDCLGPLRLGQRSSHSRPCSVHWDSSVEDVGKWTQRSSSVHGNLSEPNIGPTSKTSRSPGRLRRLMVRLSAGPLGGGPRVGSVKDGKESASGGSSSRSPRTSVDSGIEKGGTSRSRSPRWPRKFSAPFPNFNLPRPLPYRPLSSLAREDSQYDNQPVKSSLSLDMTSSRNS